MPKTEPDPLGRGFEWRLRAELDRVQPRFSPPRYMSPDAHHVGSWRLAPGALALGIVGILGLSAYAATGSANPVVWTHRIVTTIQPNTVPEAAPTPATNPTPSHHPTQGDEPSPQAEPSEHPEPSQEHWPGESTPPSGGGDDHAGSTTTSDSGLQERF